MWSIHEDAASRVRFGGNSGGQGVSNRAVGTFLTELDGIHKSRGDVLVLAATNEKDQIDRAVLRPGRFDMRIEVKPPQTIDEVRAILRSYICTLETNNLGVGDLCTNPHAPYVENNTDSTYVEDITDGIEVNSRATVSGADLVNAVNNGIRKTVSQDKTTHINIKDAIKEQINQLYPRPKRKSTNRDEDPRKKQRGTE